MVELSEFDSGEVSSMQNYIATNVQHTILQRLFTLSENPEDKANSFVVIHRILNSCKNYATTGKLREKMEKLLKEAETVYYEVYPLVLRYSNTKIEFGKSKVLRRLIAIFSDVEKNKKVNKIIDAFLIFGEKIELINIDSVIGLDLEKDQGKELMKELDKVIEKDKI